MKKHFLTLLMFAVATLGFTSCDPNNGDDDPKTEDKEYRLKKLSFLYNWIARMGGRYQAIERRHLEKIDHYHVLDPNPRRDL